MARFTKHSRILSLLLFLAQVSQCGESLSLPTLLKKAQENNPDIRVARQAWKMKVAQVSPAGTWPDPVFSYSTEKSVMGSPGMPLQSVQHFRIEQSIPFPGKLSSEARMKQH